MNDYISIDFSRLKEMSRLERANLVINYEDVRLAGVPVGEEVTVCEWFDDAKELADDIISYYPFFNLSPELQVETEMILSKYCESFWDKYDEKYLVDNALFLDSVDVHKMLLEFQRASICLSAALKDGADDDGMITGAALVKNLKDFYKNVLWGYAINKQDDEDIKNE